MSAIPTGIAFLRHVPQHLIDGFSNGEYRLWGSVLRRADGPGRGQIVGFLMEGWEALRNVEQNLPIDLKPLENMIGNSQMIAQLSTGLGVLNLGVQVAGLAVVMQRLNRISGQIEAVHRDLRVLRQDVEWLVMAEIADLRAEAESAINAAARALHYGDRVPLILARTNLDKAGRRVLYLAEDMLKSGRAVSQRALFEQFVQLGAVLVHADVGCAQALDRLDEAARSLAASTQGLRSLSDGYRARVRNFQANPRELLLIGETGRADTKAVGTRIDRIVGRIEAYVPQLQFQDALGLDADAWRALVAGEGSGLLTCITVEDSVQDDLLTLAGVPEEHRPADRGQAFAP